jgi:hypothetical protein
MEEILGLLRGLHTKVDRQENKLERLEEALDARLQALERHVAEQQTLAGHVEAAAWEAGEAEPGEGVPPADGGALDALEGAVAGPQEDGSGGVAEEQLPAGPLGPRSAAAGPQAAERGPGADGRGGQAQARPAAGRRVQPQQVQGLVQQQGGQEQQGPQRQEQQRPADDPESWHFFSLPRRRPGEQHACRRPRQAVVITMWLCRFKVLQSGLDVTWPVPESLGLVSAARRCLRFAGLWDTLAQKKSKPGCFHRFERA